MERLVVRGLYRVLAVVLAGLVVIVLVTQLFTGPASERTHLTQHAGEVSHRYDTGPEVTGPVARDDVPGHAAHELTIHVVTIGIGPVSNAAVAIDAATPVHTGPDGTCVVPSVSEGEHTVAVEHPRWGRKAQRCVVVGAMTIEVSYSPSSSLVVDVSIEPEVAPLDIILLRKGGGDTPTIAYTEPLRVYVDMAYQAVFEHLAPGEYDVTCISHASDAAVSKQAVIEHNGDTVRIDISLDRSSVNSPLSRTLLTGRISLDGAPAMQGRFFLSLQWPDGLEHTQTVHYRDGLFAAEVPRLVTGCTLVAQSSISRLPVIMELGHEVTLQRAVTDLEFVTEQERPRLLVITNTAGVPMANTPVTFARPGLSVTFHADATGTVDIGALPKGLYTVTCHPLTSLYTGNLANPRLDTSIVFAVEDATLDELALDVSLLLVSHEEFDQGRIEESYLIVQHCTKQRIFTTVIQPSQFPFALAQPSLAGHLLLSGGFTGCRGNTRFNGCFLPTEPLAVTGIEVKLELLVPTSTREVVVLDSLARPVEDAHMVTNVNRIGVAHSHGGDVAMRQQALIPLENGRYQLNLFDGMKESDCWIVSRSSGSARLLGSTIMLPATSTEELEVVFHDRILWNFDLVYRSGRRVVCKYTRGSGPSKVVRVPLLDGEVPLALVFDDQGGARQVSVTSRVVDVHLP